MKCRDCKQEIPDTASKCHVCGAYQDLRRYLDLSGVVLSLLVAIMSLSALFISQLSGIVTTRDSDIIAHLVSVQKSRIEIVINNDGTYPGVISDMQLTVRDPWAGMIFFDLHSAANSRIVKPKETINLVFSGSEDEQIAFKKWLDETGKEDRAKDSNPHPTECAIFITIQSYKAMKASASNAKLYFENAYNKYIDVDESTFWFNVFCEQFFS